MRDPSGGSSITLGDGTLEFGGGPVAAVLGLVAFVGLLAVLVVVLDGLTAVFAGFLPRWAVLPVVLASATVLVGAALYGGFRLRDRLARR